ncbi:MAG: hypothetical protein HYU39_09150 [Thaumarchaeota archaeon]|nr:hypothetical protein [Nitrososphaerota archaeon]
MIIIWYADFEGTEKDLKRINKIFSDITKKVGGTVEGPYYPQDADLMYIAKVKNFDWINQSGRIFLKKVEEEGIKITPVRYEVAVTPDEFWGKE